PAGSISILPTSVGAPLRSDPGVFPRTQIGALEERARPRPLRQRPSGCGTPTGSAGHAGATAMTCFPVFGPIFAGKFQFSGMCDSGRWTRKDHEEIKVYGGADCLHPAAGR